MNVFTRGVRNAFRNGIRAGAIIGMVGLSIGLALSMLLAYKAVGQRITSVEQSVGNTITVTPSGIRGLMGGGDPLTSEQINKIAATAHVTAVDQTLTDRLASDGTNLQSAIDAGNFGQRQFRIERQNAEGGTVMTGPGLDGKADLSNFKPPIAAIGASNPLRADSAATGGELKLSAGTSFDGTKNAKVALVGKSLAEKNSLQVGSTFSAYSQTFTVSGIFDAGNQFVNNQLIMPLPTLQELSGQSGAVTAVVAHIDSVLNLASTTTTLQTTLGDKVDVSNQSDQLKSTLDSLHSIQHVSLFSLVGATVTAGVILLLTMIMIVRERRREIGVLKAIGGSNIKVMSQFGVEALTLTLLGAAIGIIIGSLGATPVTKLLANNGASNTNDSALVGGGPNTITNRVDNPAGGSMVRGNGFRARLERSGTVQGLRNLRANVDASIVLYGLAGAVVVAAIGSTAAAALIAKVRPAEVMRAE